MNSLSHLKIGFFGTSTFALNILKKLKEHLIDIKYIVTQPPKKSGRGQKKKIHQ